MPELATGPTLYLVGSMTETSREQAARVSAMDGVETLRIPAAALLAGAWAEEVRRLELALSAGRNVVVVPECRETLTFEQGGKMARALGQFALCGAGGVGGLVATGGETARAVLDAWGVRRLRVHGEVEAGVAFSTTDGWRRVVPVVTKAGGFGDAETLVRCGEFLQRNARAAEVRI
jgi:uncharacterized protein YgbK (DUF1537 family)